jgi:hypothetical protein
MGASPDFGRAGQTTEPLGYLVRNIHREQVASTLDDVAGRLPMRVPT